MIGWLVRLWAIRKLWGIIRGSDRKAARARNRR